MSDAERPPHPREDRCILWHSDAQLPDRELLAALAKRSLTITRCHSPFAAIGALCAPGAGNGAIVLLVVDPARLARVADVVAAITRYAPRAVVWEFDSASRRLRAFGALPDAALPSTQPRQQVHTPPPEPKLRESKAGGPPRLKLAGEGPLPASRLPADDVPLSAGTPAAAPARQVLTDEELAMLLSSEPIRGNG